MPETPVNQANKDYQVQPELQESRDKKEFLVTLDSLVQLDCKGQQAV